MKHILYFLILNLTLTTGFAQTKNQQTKDTSCPCKVVKKTQQVSHKKKYPVASVKKADKKPSDSVQVSYQNSFNNLYHITYLNTTYNVVEVKDTVVKVDTVKVLVEKNTVPYGILGASVNSMPELGIWGVAGSNFYVIGEASFSYRSFQPVYYTHYGDDPKHVVHPFPVIVSKSPYQRTCLFSVGVGKYIFKNLGVHVQAGVGTTESNSPYYRKADVTTVKIGAIGKIFNRLSLKADYDFARNCVGAGLGFNF